MQWPHSTTPRYGQYLTHAHSHIIRAVAAMDSCFVLVRTHQHGITRRKGITEDHRPRRLLPRRVQKHSFKRQLHSVNVVAVAVTVQTVSSDSTFLARTRLRWSDNFCPHRVVVITIATRPKRAWPSPLGLNFTGVQCRPWSNGTIVILTDPWRPILRCYYDFVQWLILWEHEECATSYKEIIWMSSFYQVAKSE